MPRPEKKRSSQKTELPGETFEDAFEGDNTKAPGAQSLTAPQKKKLDVLVSQLRNADKIETHNLYHAVGIMRDVDPGDLGHALKEPDEDGVWHWSPLRDTLSREEASSLIDRLSKLQDAT
jgi:GH43 family beta-xylosidase